MATAFWSSCSKGICRRTSRYRFRFPFSSNASFGMLFCLSVTLKHWRDDEGFSRFHVNPKYVKLVWTNGEWSFIISKSCEHVPCESPPPVDTWPIAPARYPDRLVVDRAWPQLLNNCIKLISNTPSTFRCNPFVDTAQATKLCFWALSARFFNFKLLSLFFRLRINLFCLPGRFRHNATSTCNKCELNKS